MGKKSGSEWMTDTKLENTGIGYKGGERKHSDSGFREKQNGSEEGGGNSKQSIGFKTKRYKVEVQQCDLHQTRFHSHPF